MNRVFVSVIALTAVAGVAQATLFSYGSFSGANVQFNSVFEETGAELNPLFGAPTVSGDSLSFSPTSFAATSSGGGSSIVDSQIGTRIVANAGRAIPAITLSESGDYSLIGSGTSLTSVFASAAVFIRIEEVNGAAVTPIVFSGNLVMAPSSSFNLASPGPGIAQIWSGSGFFDLDAMVTGAGLSGSATKVYMTLDNTLAATSQSGTVAFIKKKTFGGTALTVVPTPGSATLLGLGLIAAGRRRR